MLAYRATSAHDRIIQIAQRSFDNNARVFYVLAIMSIETENAQTFMEVCTELGSSQ